MRGSHLLAFFGGGFIGMGISTWTFTYAAPMLRFACVVVFVGFALIGIVRMVASRDSDNNSNFTH